MLGLPPVTRVGKKKAARKVLAKARTILVEEGWTTGRMGMSGHKSCLLGAIRQAGSGNPHDYYESTDIGKIAIALVQAEIPEWQGIIVWNDWQKSPQPVLDLLEKVSA